MKRLKVMFNWLMVILAFVSASSLDSGTMIPTYVLVATVTYLAHAGIKSGVLK